MKALLKRFLYTLALSVSITLLFFPQPVFPEDTEELPPVVDTIEKLYQEYEEIDRKIEELKRDLEAQTPSPLVTPLTITVKKDGGFTLLSVELKVNDKYLLSHLYSATENMAMEQGGRQLLYNGAFRKGTHRISITYRYSLSQKAVERSTGWTIKLQDEPFILEIFFRKADKESIEPVAARVYLVDEKELVDNP